jgi:hypothetical protein
MPFLAEVTLEYGDVETQGVTREEIIRAAGDKPRDTRDWYLTLRRGDDENEEYMDATMEDDSTFSLRVREDGKRFQTGAAIERSSSSHSSSASTSTTGRGRRCAPGRRFPRSANSA